MVRSSFGFARKELRVFYPRFLAFFAGWVSVWIVVEAIVIGTEVPPFHPGWLIMHLAYFAGTSFFELAMIELALAIRDDRMARIRNATQDVRLVLRFTTLKLAVLPLFLLGTALLLVPGAWVIGRSGLVFFHLVDHRSGVLNSWRATRAAVEGRLGMLTWFSLILVLFNAAGAALLGIGLLFTLPISVLAVAHVYRELVVAPLDQLGSPGL